MKHGEEKEESSKEEYQHFVSRARSFQTRDFYDESKKEESFIC